MTGPQRIPDDAGAVSDAYAGDRVVVRYRLGDDTPADWRSSGPQPRPDSARAGKPARTPTLSDITGRLLDDRDPLIIDRDGDALRVPRSAVTSVRLLSATVLRNSDIRALEHAAALAWPGTESAWIDGWLVRAGGGVSRRANSAVPLERSARVDPETLAAIGSWYAERGLPTLMALPDRLVPPHQIAGRARSGSVHMLVRDIALAGGPIGEAVDAPAESEGSDGAGAGGRYDEPGTHSADLNTTPSNDWLRCYTNGDSDIEVARRVVGAADGPVAFVTVRGTTTASSTPTPVAIGRGAVTAPPDGARWLGVTALWTDPAARRRGHGDTVLTRLLAWGAEQGAERAYLQVEADNRVAGSWYRARGFGLHHTYRYVQPTTGVR
ncbi:GNAT family N-acetyltransferase [Gordonia sinesedis]